MVFVFGNFGPLIVYLVLSRYFGVRVATAATCVFVIADVARRLWRRTSFTRLYGMSAALTLSFGAVDLLSSNPFMLKFEPAIINLAVCIAFVAGTRAKTSLIQEIVEERRGAPFVNRPDLQRFFRYLTLLWAGYFLIKAGVCLWLVLTLPLERALAAISVSGGVSLGVMIIVSTTQGKRLHAVCRRLGLLPPRPEAGEGSLTVRAATAPAANSCRRGAGRSAGF